jgi:subtilisin family serine protease
MTRKPFAWGVVLALLLGLTSMPILAQDPELQPAPQPIEHPWRSPQVRVPAEGIQIGLEDLPYGARSAATQVPAAPVMIELEGAPLAVRYAQNLDAGRALMSGESQRAYVAELASQQQQLLPQIQATGARIVSTYQKAYNGIQVHIPLGQLGALANLPGVKAVHRMPLHMPSRGASMPWIGVDEVWADFGLDGTGITIAIIDSGIDYYHADFGGSGDPVDYAADDPNIIEPGTFPTAKVVGGYDFAGPTYDPGSDDPDIATPDPDPDPLDVFGHGSHVAGIAAGLGVPGEIAPGAAPGALLYAVKVFADVQAATTLTADGIEWAMDPNQDGDISDRVDVINLSLGGAFGSPDDPSTVAANNAVSVGIVVAASAGNDGDVMYIHDSPGNAVKAIAVAASVDNDPADIPGPADTIANFSSRGPRGPDSLLKPDISAPGYGINSADAGTGTGGAKFSGTSMSTPHVAGVAALLLELHPDWTPDEIKAALMNSAVDLATSGGDRYPLSRQGAGRVDARAAAGLEALALTDSGNLSFGVVPVDSDMTLLQQVKVMNKGTVTKTFDISWSFQFPGEDAGMGVTLNLPAEVTVNPGSYANVPVGAQIDVDTLPSETYEFGDWSVAEYDGFVTFVNPERASDTLRVPFHLIPRPTSHSQGPLIVEYVAPAPPTGFQIENTGPISASVYLLPGHGQDANEPDVADYADIRYFGLDSFGVQETGTMTDTVLSFAINTYAPWHTPQPYWAEFDIYVDNNEDGSADYVVFNFNRGAVTADEDSDVFIPVVVNLNTGDIILPTFPPPFDEFLLTNVTDFNAATIEIPVKGIDIGLDAGNTDFEFWVIGFDYDGNPDVTTVGRGDAAHPPLVFDWTALDGQVPPASTNAATVLPDFVGYHANGRPDILALYYHDVPGTGQAQYIPLTATWNAYYLPLILKAD